MGAPIVELMHLHRADGSATYTSHGYTILGAVNGPLEVQRRDELAEEATIEVNVRPAAGVGSPKERHFETLLHNTLRSIILTRAIPRTLVQITLQIRSLPEEHASSGVNSSLAILPHLLHTSLLALLSAAIPLRTILTSLLVAFPSPSTSSNKSVSQSPLVSPTSVDLRRAGSIRSTHVFAFSGDRRLLLSESEGVFGVQEWDAACEAAEEICCARGQEQGSRGGHEDEDEAEDMEDGGVRLGGEDSMDLDTGATGAGLDSGSGGGEKNLHKWLREIVKRKVEAEQRWKTAG